MGSELIETLEVYVESGQNMRETARRLHLAPRTVAYRLERIARLIGHPLDGPTLRRLSVAAFAYRTRRGADRRGPERCRWGRTAVRREARSCRGAARIGPGDRPN